MFTEKEIQVQRFIEDTFVPAIHKKLSQANPMHYIRYGGRCCKQVAYLLELYLTKALPDYEWSSWDSLFNDECEVYSHAWTYGSHKEDRPGIVMDYGKLEDEYRFFLPTSGNSYPEKLVNFYGEDDDKWLDEEEEGERKRLFPFGNETFTGKPFEVLFQELEQELGITY